MTLKFSNVRLATCTRERSPGRCVRSHAAVTTSLPRASFASDPDRSDTSTYVALRARIVAVHFDFYRLRCTHRCLNHHPSPGQEKIPARLPTFPRNEKQAGYFFKTSKFLFMGPGRTSKGPATEPSNNPFIRLRRPMSGTNGTAPILLFVAL